jgi:phosphoenolpyruvate-protein phosphotransferase
MQLHGLSAAPGIAIGPVWRFGAADLATEPLLDIRAAAARAADELTGLAGRLRDAGHADDAAILEAQALMAEDPMLLDEAEALVAGRPDASADPAALAAALETAAGAAAGTLARLPDPLLAARAADVRDVGARIARIITGRTLSLPDRPSVAVAEDLPPSVTAEIPAGTLLGIALEGGSPVSHAAILARGLGIPAIVAIPGLVAALAAASSRESDRIVALDGDAATIDIDPSRERLAELEGVLAGRRRRAAGAAALRGTPGATADGTPVRLLANIGRPEDDARALEAGAEGVGLFRTEFLFLGRSDAPSEDEQVQAYASVLRDFGPGRPVVIRLADIGGDKEIPYLHLPSEANPFLGVRGLRLAHDHRALLVTQLRAIARAGALTGSMPHVMAPMVATAEDVDLLHELEAQATAELDAERVERAARLVVGIMVEVPSAALCAAELAPSVAFFSVGSNDLTQYLLAMDRTNARLASSADALHPAVLRAVRATVEGADAAGILVAVCGELAGDPAGALVLVGLGVDELSMDAASLDAVRAALRGTTDTELRSLAELALHARTAGEVRTAAAALVARAVPADPGAA